MSYVTTWSLELSGLFLKSFTYLNNKRCDLKFSNVWYDAIHFESEKEAEKFVIQNGLKKYSLRTVPNNIIDLKQDTSKDNHVIVEKKMFMGNVKSYLEIVEWIKSYKEESPLLYYRDCVIEFKANDSFVTVESGEKIGRTEDNRFIVIHNVARTII